MSVVDVPMCADGSDRTPRVVQDRTVLAQLGAALDALHDAVGTHIMARRTWLQTCLDHDTRYEPLAVVVPGPDDSIEAVALLAVRRRGRRASIVALGHGHSDVSAFPARTPAAAAALADAVVEMLVARRGSWTLRVRHIDRGDPVAARIAARLRHGWLVPGGTSPCLVLTPGRDLRSYVGKHYVKNRRRRLAKIAELGHPVVEEITRDPDAIAAALPEIVDICRMRDLAKGRTGMVATPEGAARFRDAVLAHAREGRMLLLTARIGDALAGYALCFVDGTVVRVWNCRFDPAWSAYGIGQICRAALIDHAIATGLTSVDWMLGNEPYKQALSNASRPAEDLFAASGLLLAMLTRLGLLVRAWARTATADDADPPRWVRIVRRVGKPLLGS
ncbi:GNAT family N-acetyltransferase [Pseudonocardia thermophila]|jgi:Protein involved in cellulose biosynthesis (CelD)|uniref:GNAT family N-acetyltransferase n=1 Tax=Pseudonocardia thermophila TaxID=1848 RepID=UPI00248DB2FF|nr:GNAT family N-acetyltransferase [Pseudonocardia thermophila]